MLIEIETITTVCPHCDTKQDTPLPSPLVSTPVVRCESCQREYFVGELTVSLSYNFPVSPRPSISINAVSGSLD